MGSTFNLGFEKEKTYSGESKTHTLAGISPYFKLDFRWVGFGGGLTFGNIRFEEMQYDVDEGSNEIKTSAIAFMYYIRLFPYDYFYISLKHAFLQPTITPNPYNMLGIGSGLGRTDGRNVEIGVSSTEEQNFYFSCTIPYKSKFESGLFFSYGEDGDTGNPKYQLALQFRYKFNFKNKELFQKPL